MQVPFVDLKAQYQKIKEEIQKELIEVCESCSFVLGPKVRAFEKAFAEYCEAPQAIAVNSGTSADQLAVQALIKPGDEVITTPNTFIATAAAITAAGGRVKFVDIDEKTYNMDPQKLAEAITPQTRAVVPVHLYGQPADMDPIREIAAQHGLAVIEDAAQAHGALYKGKKVGNLADAAAFSFYPGKNLGAYGEGGAVTTSREDVAKFVRMYRDHGSREKYIHEFEGHNMRMSGFQGAVLGVKLKYLEDWIAARRENAARYNALLADVEGIVTPYESPDVRHVYHLYVIRVKDREGLQKYLAEQGIASGYHYKIPLHLQKAYAYLGYREGDFPVTERMMREIISLPMYPELTAEQIAYVCEHVKTYVTRQAILKKY
ncbi:MAG: DegT/DnrJ/EryC1/StrS family aminotransferase [Calditrichia bacterium]